MDSLAMSCLIFMRKGGRSFKGWGLSLAMNSQGIVSNQGNAIADNETILHLLTLVLHVQFAVGVFIIGGETDIYFTEVCAMKNLLK